MFAIFVMLFLGSIFAVIAIALVVGFGALVAVGVMIVVGVTIGLVLASVVGARRSR